MLGGMLLTALCSLIFRFLFKMSSMSERDGVEVDSIDKGERRNFEGRGCRSEKVMEGPC